MQEPSVSSGLLHGRRGKQLLGTAIIDMASIKRPVNCCGRRRTVHKHRFMYICTYWQPHTQGALAAAVALSCSVIVMAAPGSVNETPRISSARSTPHYRKSKLPHPRPAAARAVCRLADRPVSGEALRPSVQRLCLANAHGRLLDHFDCSFGRCCGSVGSATSNPAG